MPPHFSDARPIKTSPIWQESFTWHIPRICIYRGENVERGYSDCGYRRIGNMGASEIYPRRINAKEVLISQKGE